VHIIFLFETNVAGSLELATMCICDLDGVESTALSRGLAVL